jgi:hypothetical protein
LVAAFDRKAIEYLFQKPETDGSFKGPILDYFRALGRRQRVLFLCFAPKAAGTFFRQAAMAAVGGELFRVTHAQGGRDATLYLPTFLACYLDPDTLPMITHIHMQALPANRNFIDAFGLKPVIMIRSISDMLASYWDMLDIDPVARADGLNCLIPSDFVSKSRDAKADFMIDIVAPWYASYFATWKDFADAAPDTVCVLRYDAFRAEPAATVHQALLHAGFAVSRAKCDEAVEKVWGNRNAYRFNKGVEGRAREYFSPAQIERLARQLSQYKQLEPWMGELMGGAAAEKIRLAS